MLDSIITLENGCDYAILDQTEVENRKFYYGVKVDSNENSLDEYEVFEEHIDGDDTYLDILKDGDLKKAIIIDFTNNYLESVAEAIAENE